MSTHGVATPDAAALQAACCDPDGAPVDAGGGLRWESLTLGDIPGVGDMAKGAKPVIDTVVGVLQAIATVLDIIAAILLAMPNPITALVMAAVAILKKIIDDLLATGVYAFAHAPGITSAWPGWASLGYPTTPVKTFVAGFQEEPPPPPAPDAYAAWAATFRASFDDVGDEDRPQVSTGATIEAVFLAAAAANPEVLRNLLYLLGKLLSIRPFVAAFENWKAAPNTPDPDGQALYAESVAPDWESRTLADLFPVLRKLTDLASKLEGLLRDVDNLIGLIKKLIEALRTKVQVLLDIAEAIQAVITFLEQLQATGFYALAVSTTQGVPGLTTAFDSAQNRPPGGYMGAVCLLAAGPGMTAVTPLWILLGQKGNLEASAAAFGEVWEAEYARTAAAVEKAVAPAVAQLEASVEEQRQRYDDLVQRDVRMSKGGPV
ncbi:MAG: hypothetical protein V4850_08625 [Myxococcota bacterium]